MPGINLYQKEQQQTQKKRLSEHTAIASLILLLVIFGVYGGLKTYNNIYYVSKIEETKQQIATVSSQLDSGVASEVYDFSLRRDEMEKAVTSTTKILPNYLLIIQKSMIPGARVEKIEYDSDKKQMIISTATDSLETAAKQIRGFKMQAEFALATVSGMGVTKREDGTAYNTFQLMVPLN